MNKVVEKLYMKQTRWRLHFQIFLGKLIHSLLTVTLTAYQTVDHEVCVNSDTCLHIYGSDEGMLVVVKVFLIIMYHHSPDTIVMTDHYFMILDLKKLDKYYPLIIGANESETCIQITRSGRFERFCTYFHEVGITANNSLDYYHFVNTGEAVITCQIKIH